MTPTGTVTAANLRAIGIGKSPLAGKIAESFNAIAPAYGITTPLRQAHFFAQLCHESGNFQFVREIWGPTAAQKRYEGRKDLGNIRPGDGERFKGRGPLQVTGRANYRDLTAWLRSRSGSVDVPDFEAEPEHLEEFPWAILGAFWFWDTRRINVLADADDVLAVTKRINGGTNGLAERKAALARAKQEFGVVSTAAPVPRKPVSDRMSIPKGKWAEEALAAIEVEGVQKRLRDLGWYQVGKVDGKWGPSTSGALIGFQTQAGITPDGHWGPESRAALFNPEAKRRVVDEVRAKTTAEDLRKQGSVIAIQGYRVTWASVFGLLVALFGAANAAYMAPAELPFGSSIILGLIPPPFGSIISAVLPYLIAFVPLAYAAFAAQGMVRARVVAEQTGLHNGEPDPAPSPPVRFPADSPGLGGILGSLFGRSK